MTHAWAPRLGSGPDTTLLVLVLLLLSTAGAAAASASAAASVGDDCSAGVAGVRLLASSTSPSPSSESPLSSSKSLNASSFRDLTASGEGGNAVEFWAQRTIDALFFYLSTIYSVPRPRMYVSSYAPPALGRLGQT